MGVTPYSSEAMRRVRPAAASRPSTTPASDRVRACRSTMALTEVFAAPMAMRTPISRVRWETMYEITP